MPEGLSPDVHPEGVARHYVHVDADLTAAGRHDLHRESDGRQVTDSDTADRPDRWPRTTSSGSRPLLPLTRATVIGATPVNGAPSVPVNSAIVITSARA